MVKSPSTNGYIPVHTHTQKGGCTHKHTLGYFPALISNTVLSFQYLSLLFFSCVVHVKCSESGTDYNYLLLKVTTRIGKGFGSGKGRIGSLGLADANYYI